MITHIKNIIPDQKGIGAFNTFNQEITRAILAASAKTKKALIIQVTEKSLKYGGVEALSNLINKTAEEFGGCRAAIHLDHGKDLSIIKKCLKLGFSSVHFDGSELPFKKNIAITKKVVAMAKRHKAWVQGEVGVIAGQEGALKSKRAKLAKEYFTNPKLARDYVRQTMVNTLAVSVGSLHGEFKGKEKLDFPRIREIKKAVGRTPLVLHGGSGVSQAELKKAIKSGMTIFNLDTTLRIAFVDTLKKDLKKNPEIIDPRFFLERARLAIEKEVIKYLKTFNQ